MAVVTALCHLERKPPFPMSTRQESDTFFSVRGELACLSPHEASLTPGCGNSHGETPGSMAAMERNPDIPTSTPVDFGPWQPLQRNPKRPLTSCIGAELSWEPLEARSLRSPSWQRGTPGVLLQLEKQRRFSLNMRWRLLTTASQRNPNFSLEPQRVLGLPSRTGSIILPT